VSYLRLACVSISEWSSDPELPKGCLVLVWKLDALVTKKNWICLLLPDSVPCLSDPLPSFSASGS
jgi:hypothetical protein